MFFKKKKKKATNIWLTANDENTINPFLLGLQIPIWTINNYVYLEESESTIDALLDREFVELEHHESFSHYDVFDDPAINIGVRVYYNYEYHMLLVILPSSDIEILVSAINIAACSTPDEEMRHTILVNAFTELFKNNIKEENENV